MNLYFIPVYEWITAPLQPYLILSLCSIEGHLGYFHISAVRVILPQPFVCTFLCVDVCFLLGIYVGVDLLSLCQTLRNCQIYFQNGCTILHFCQQCMGFQLLWPPPALRVSLMIAILVSVKSYLIVLFDLHLPSGDWLWITYHVLLAICISSLEMSIEICCPFKIGLFLFLLLSS